MVDHNRLCEINLADGGQFVTSEQVEQERKVAIFDLLENNYFKPTPRQGSIAPDGPYRLDLALKDRQLLFEISVPEQPVFNSIHLSLSPFRQVLRDYFQIVERYYAEHGSLPAAQLETIDMARRGIHNEGARILAERLEGKIDLDTDTARRLFTLLCVLHFKG